MRFVVLSGVLAFVPMSRSFAQDGALSAPLDLDDLCADPAGHSACALSARQLRGGALATEAEAAAPLREPEEALRASAARRRRRRRRHTPRGSASDLTRAEEAALNSKVEAAKGWLADLAKTLEGIERYENETRRMLLGLETAPRTPAAGDGLLGGRGPLAPAAARRRRARASRRAVRVRRVVRKLDALQRELDDLREKMSLCEQLGEWTDAKIDNPSTPDFDAGGGRAGRAGGGVNHGEDDGLWGVADLGAAPVASKRDLEEQLSEIREEMSDADGEVAELRDNAEASRARYLKRAKGPALIDLR